MSQRLSVFRAARLVGITRSALQQRIHDGELSTFEGQVSLEDLLRVFPETQVGHDSEYERIQNIKSQAFARRVSERILPDKNVLARRMVEMGRDLAASRMDVSRYEYILKHLQERLQLVSCPPNTDNITAIAEWLDKALREPTFSDQATHDLMAKDTVLRIMSAHITIHPGKHEFWLDGNDTLLDAGVRSGLALNYGCTSGNCGLCKARVIRGEVKEIRHHDYVLSEAEKNMNYILMCTCTAVTDLDLEALVAEDEKDIPLQEVTTKVKSVDTSHPSTVLLHVQTPRTQRLRFLAGQSVTLSLANGLSTDLPIASCPCDDRNIIFHLTHDNSTPFNEYLIDKTRKGDEITIVGPHGDFLLNEDSARSPIFIAYGTGFAPIKSLIEHAMALEFSTSMHLYWVADNEDGLYAHNLCRSWADALEEFHYHPLIAADPVEKILATHQDLTNIDVYAAGQAEKIKQVRQRLLESGLMEHQIIAGGA